MSRLVITEQKHISVRLSKFSSRIFTGYKGSLPSQLQLHAFDKKRLSKVVHEL